MDNHRGLKDKVIVVTGGCGDIGGATTQKLAAFGAKVVVFDIRTPEAGRDHARRMGAVEYLKVDQGNDSEVHQGIEAVSRATSEGWTS